jgi:molecular chaperone DnaK
MVLRRAVGIDLGTTYSAVAVLNHGGQPEIVPNADGERTTASAVYFQADGSVIVGSEAANMAGKKPDRVVRWAKRELAESDWSFRVGSTSYSAVDISALVLRKVRQDAQQTVGLIDAAVVTVPAYFDEPRRKATMDAAVAADIEVLRLINEPTAASLAYASSGQVRGTILVYDLGGGTFDVSVVDVPSLKEVNVLGTGGSYRLGGVDFDTALAEFLDDRFHAQHGVRLLGGDEGPHHELMLEAERVKRSLSKMSEAVASIRHDGRSLDVEVDRKTFDDLTRKLVRSTRNKIEEVLEEAGKQVSDVTAVALVGGSTRVPAVPHMLEEMFGRPPLRNVNPDEAVALGASIQAGIILAGRGDIDLPAAAVEVVRDVRVSDVTGHGFGTIADRIIDGRRITRNDVIIPRNSRIPVEVTKSFGTKPDMRMASCVITQGDDEDPEFVNRIAMTELELPPGRPEGLEIRVTYRFDANGLMDCEFEDVESGAKAQVQLDVSGAIARESAERVAGIDVR